MLWLIHAIIGLILLLSHALFFGRALRMRAVDGKPGKTDKVARSLSHICLPLAIVTGIIAAVAGKTVEGPSIFHVVIGLAPMVAIFVFTPLLPIKRRIPWLLPGINLILFLIATVSGVINAYFR